MLKKSIYILISIITIGFSLINNSSNNIKVDYKNIKVVESSNDYTINETSNGIEYNVDLNTPGDYYEFTLDLVNDSNKNIRINEINNNTLTEKQKRYLDYKVLYIDNTPLRINDVIESNTKKTIKVIIYFKEDLEVEDLPTKEEIINLNLDVNIMPID